MSKYTPGPWAAKENAYNYWGVYSPHETLLAEAPFKYRPANIRLMAAAPEMLKLLEEAELELRHASMYPFETDNKDAESEKETADEIAALLRRIEGEEETE